MFQQDLPVQFLTILGPFGRQANKITDQHGAYVSDSGVLGGHSLYEFMGERKEHMFM